MTSKEFSTSLKVDNSQYSKIEQGKLMPTINLLMEINSIYGISLDWLLTGQGEMTNSKEDNFKMSMGDNNSQINVGSSHIINESPIPYNKRKKESSVITNNEIISLKAENQQLTVDIQKLKSENQHLQEKITLLEKNIRDKELIISMLSK